MQDPNEDTEWNDILRKHKIIPDKPKAAPAPEEFDLTEAVKSYDDMDMDELEDDEEAEAIMESIRKKRIAEMKAKFAKAKFGEVREISAIDYVNEVNKAGEGIWVILHLYKQGIPLCTLLNQHLTLLARKFPEVKFLKSISTTCIPDFPDRNLPTFFVYKEDKMVHNWVGTHNFGGMTLTCDQLEWKLHSAGIVKSTLVEDEIHKEIQDVMMTSIRSSNNRRNNRDDSSDDDE